MNITKRFNCNPGSRKDLSERILDTKKSSKKIAASAMPDIFQDFSDSKSFIEILLQKAVDISYISG